MPEIKTREVAKGTVKAIDKSAMAAERMKSAYIRTKDKADHSLYSAEGSPDEYTADRVSNGTETAARETVHQLDKFGRKGVKDTKENDRTHMDLYYSYSQDNINYTTAEKIFSPSSSSNAFDNRGLYRSSFLYANGRYYMFYSALNKKTGPSGVGLICGRDVYTMG